MPIQMISRNGPPAAMNCPAFLCAICLEPVRANDGAAFWFTHGFEKDSERAIDSPVDFAHRGRCFSSVEDRNEDGERALLMDMTLVEFLKHLLQNAEKGFTEEGNVEYVAPVPSKWRLGYYESTGGVA